MKPICRTGGGSVLRSRYFWSSLCGCGAIEDAIAPEELVSVNMLIGLSAPVYTEVVEHGGSHAIASPDVNRFRVGRGTNRSGTSRHRVKSIRTAVPLAKLL